MRPVIVVPAFNEAASIAAVVQGARAHGPVVVVDDGSSDATGSLAASTGAEVLRHPRRLGKAQAIRTGVTAARRRGATVVVTLDGDGQHDPAQIGTLLAAASARTLVVGGRLDDEQALTPERLHAIRIAGFFVAWASGLRLRDTQSGFRAYPMALFDEIPTRRHGFVFETEVLLRAAAAGFAVVEVPVRALPRAGQHSRFRPQRDGMAIASYLAGHVLARWGLEARAAVGTAAAVLSRDRRQARHGALLQEAAAYGEPAWGLALGVLAGRRLLARLTTWYRHPRLRRAGLAAMGSVTAPPVLLLLLAQSLGGRRLPDLVAPVVAALYSQDRLDAAGEVVRPPAPGVSAAPGAPLTREGLYAPPVTRR